MKRMVCALSALVCATVLAVSATAQTPDVTGDWDITINSPQGARQAKATFKQEGEKLTGKYKGAFGESDLTGTVKGDKIEFSFKVSGQIEGTLTYTGSTDGKTMKGKVNLAGMGEGTFSGKKQ